MNKPIILLFILLVLIVVGLISSMATETQILDKYCLSQDSIYTIVDNERYCRYDDTLNHIEWME